MSNLPRSTPSEQGVDRTGIDAFVAAAQAAPGVELHSLMVVRHGQVIAERWWHPYAPQSPHLMYSLSKSFTSTALGFAVSEGLVDLDATVLSYFPEHDAEVTDERTRAIKVRHVASMASGHLADTLEHAYRAGDGDLLLGLLRTPPEHDPGSVFAYNQPCTFALAAIIRRVSGGTLTDFLRPRLYEPLGITPYGWQTYTPGAEIGFSGLHVTTESIAKLGLVYLNNGRWDGHRYLSEQWVAEATRAHVPTGRGQKDWDQGYGFQFWRSLHGYRGDGAYGQFMLVLPEADAVVAITSQSPDMQAVLDCAWTHLLPALTAGSGPAGPWPEVSPSLAGPVGSPAGAPADGTFTPGPGNELHRLDTVDVRDNTLTVEGVAVPLGGPGWTTTGAVSAAHAWRDGRLHVDLIFVETPHRLHLTLDPVTSQFQARWAAEPLGELPLTAMRMP